MVGLPGLLALVQSCGLSYILHHCSLLIIVTMIAKIKMRLMTVIRSAINTVVIVLKVEFLTPGLPLITGYCDFDIHARRGQIG